MYLCLDCFCRDSGQTHTCPACHSSRIIHHHRLAGLGIAHIDCDAFFAAIEKRDHPALRDKPVIVGGGRRGVVATCCYIARLHGVRSAMPMFKALKACPEAVIIRPRHAVYKEVSSRIRAYFERLTPLVQMVSLDEAYLDLNGTERLNEGFAALALARSVRAIEKETGLTVSVGLADNKFLAKTASEIDKPRGFAVLSTEEAAGFLAAKPVSYLHGVGRKLADRLTKDGYRLIEDLQSARQDQLIRQYGETGLWLHQRAHGLDDRPVRTDPIRKSVSSERTFEQDISDSDTLIDRLWQVCEDTARRAKALNLEGATLTLKLKTRTFRTLTRSRALTTPTNLAQTLFRSARPLLLRETGKGQAYRLIGTGLSHLSEARWDSRDLIDPLIEKRAQAERASDRARARFGSQAIMTGRTLRQDIAGK